MKALSVNELALLKQIEKWSNTCYLSAPNEWTLEVYHKAPAVIALQTVKSLIAKGLVEKSDVNSNRRGSVVPPLPEFGKQSGITLQLTTKGEIVLQEGIERINARAKRQSGFSNRELLNEYYRAVQPDDMDGCFTTLGIFEKDTAQTELELRLQEWLAK